MLAELLIQLNRINATHGRLEEFHDLSQAPEEKFVCSSIEEPSDFELPPQDASLPDAKKRVRLLVVAATNRPEDCDQALLRRFGVRVMVNLPSRSDRKKILKRFLKGIHHTLSAEQLDSLSLETEDWTGSDLESLTREAAMAPVRECIRTAALLKRRNARAEQKGGESSNGDHGAVRDGSHERFLEIFSRLRPVSFQDFKDAIAFWAYNQGSVDPTCATDFNAICQINGQTIHYDSSSDEED